MALGELFRWGLILQAAALVHFVRRRPDTFWLWVILFFGGAGAAVYLAVEALPDLTLLRASVNRFSRRRRIGELELVIKENSAVGNLEELADLLLEEGQFARARELYDRVISPRTDGLDPYYRRGMAALGLGDAAAAVADLERVVTKDPRYDFHRAIGLLAHAYALTEDRAKADSTFKAALEASTLSETEFNYAAFLLTEGRGADARAIAQRMLDRQRTIPRYLRRRERPWFRKAGALLKKIPA